MYISFRNTEYAYNKNSLITLLIVDLFAMFLSAIWSVYAIYSFAYKDKNTTNCVTNFNWAIAGLPFASFDIFFSFILVMLFVRKLFLLIKTTDEIANINNNSINTTPHQLTNVRSSSYPSSTATSPKRTRPPQIDPPPSKLKETPKIKAKKTNDIDRVVSVDKGKMDVSRDSPNNDSLSGNGINANAINALSGQSVTSTLTAPETSQMDGKQHIAQSSSMGHFDINLKFVSTCASDESVLGLDLTAINDTQDNSKEDSKFWQPDLDSENDNQTDNDNDKDCGNGDGNGQIFRKSSSQIILRSASSLREKATKSIKKVHSVHSRTKITMKKAKLHSDIAMIKIISKFTVLVSVHTVSCIVCMVLLSHLLPTAAVCVDGVINSMCALYCFHFYYKNYKKYCWSCHWVAFRCCACLLFYEQTKFHDHNNNNHLPMPVKLKTKLQTSTSKLKNAMTHKSNRKNNNNKKKIAKTCTETKSNDTNDNTNINGDINNNNCNGDNKNSNTSKQHNVKIADDGTDKNGHDDEEDCLGDMEDFGKASRNYHLTPKRDTLALAFSLSVLPSVDITLMDNHNDDIDDIDDDDGNSTGNTSANETGDELSVKDIDIDDLDRLGKYNDGRSALHSTSTSMGQLVKVNSNISVSVADETNFQPKHRNVSKKHLNEYKDKEEAPFDHDKDEIIDVHTYAHNHVDDQK